MDSNRLTWLDDDALLRSLDRIIAQDRRVTAELLAHLAEVDARQLYLGAACASMHVYCVERLHFSDGAAYKRIRAARAARNHPRLLRDLAKGRLHLAAICSLAAYLTKENVHELVTAATHRSRDEIECWLASRFAPTSSASPSTPRGRVTRIPAAGVEPAGTPREESPGSLFAATNEPAADANQLSPGTVDLQVPTPTATSTAPARFVVQLHIDEATHAVLREVQALLGHAVPPGDLVAVFQRALAALRRELLRRKAGQADHPRLAAPPRPDARTRTIPAATRRAVWQRDGARCTFRSKDGRQCSARRGLEFDHVVPIARGGESTVEGLRLRCRAHNQYEAERVFGAAFMAGKRRRVGERARIRG